MSRTTWGRNFKDNPKLILCLAGIIIIIAILVSMRPLQPGKNSVAVVKPAGSISGGSSLSQSQAGSAEGIMTASSSLQGTQTGNTQSSPAVASPAPSSPPTAADQDVLYPIDPTPCKSYIPATGYCGSCGAYPMEGNTCFRRCPTGSEIMCAYE